MSLVSSKPGWLVDIMNTKGLAFHYSVHVDFIFLSFGIMGFIVELNG